MLSKYFRFLCSLNLLLLLALPTPVLALNTVNLSVNPTTGNEADTTVITITATTSAAVTEDQAVDLAVIGVDANDYTLSSSTITIADGQTTGTIAFTIIDDSEFEGTETATFTINNPSTDIALGSTVSQVVNITDNDVSLVINEIDYDQPSTDTAEFIEIKNISNVPISLNGYTVDLFSNATGTVYKTITLPNVSLAAGDYYVICGNNATVANCDLDHTKDTNLIQNGSPDAIAIKKGTFIVDTVSYEGSSIPATYTEITGIAAADSSTVALVGFSRYPDGTDTNNNNTDFALKCITPGTANSINDSSSCYAISINDPTALNEGNSGTKTIDFTVSLSHAAAQDVIVNYATANDTATSGSDYTAITSTALTFSAGTNEDKTFTVTVSDDEIDEGTNETFKVNLSSPSNNAQLSTTTGAIEGIGTITDDDTAGFTVTEIIGTLVSETGTTDTFTVILDSKPTSDVEISVTSADSGEVTVDKSTLTFTASNWDTAQTVTVTGIDDIISDGDQTTTITLTVVDANSDDQYDPVDDQTVNVMTMDDDIANIDGTNIGGNINLSEGGETDSYDIKLSTQPSGDVEITITADAQTELSKNAGINYSNNIVLTFTNGNWNIAQIITVQAIDDTNVEGSHNGMISHAITGTVNDINYPTSLSLTLGNITTNITDNDSLPPTKPSPPAPTTDTGGSTSTPLPDTMTVFTKFAGQGSGTISSSPSGINCQTADEECQATFETASRVKLTAKADSGSIFDHWSSKDCDTEMFLISSRTCTANFKLTSRTLTVSYPENGMISSSPQGINCGNTSQKCWYKFDGGANINLTAIANPDYMLDVWSQNCPNGKVQLLENTKCSATFITKPAEPVVITPVDPIVQDVIPTVTNIDLIVPINPNIDEPAISTNTVSFSEPSYKVAENAGEIGIIVTRVGTKGKVSIELHSSEDDRHKQLVETLVWDDGIEGDLSVLITIIDNDIVDGNQEVILSLGAGENVEFSEPNTAVLTIVDDDTVIDIPVIDTPAKEVVNLSTISMIIHCNTSGTLNEGCDANGKTITDLKIEEDGELVHGVIDAPLENNGRLSNLTVTEKGSTIGGKVTGYVKNLGLMTDFVFVGGSFSGANDEGEVVGTIAGLILNNSKIGGSFADVYLGPNTHITGGILEGQIIGDREQPAILENLLIKPNSIISNVIIGDDMEWKGVIFRENVTFSIHMDYMKARQIVQLPALGDSIIIDFNSKYISTSFARFTGGASENSGIFKHNKTIKRKSLVTIKSNLLVDPRHIGKQADILVVAIHEGKFYMLNSNGKPVSWNGNLDELIAFQSTHLNIVQQLDIWDNQLDIAGSVKVYVGYRLGSEIVYSPEDVIEMEFTE